MFIRVLSKHFSLQIAQADVGGPIPKVVWAPSEYGDVLASCSYDGAVSIWEEVVLEGDIH
mgnify:FL=1